MKNNQRKLEQSALIVATFASFMGPFMISAVNVALPVIQKEFTVGAVTLSWIATAYLLATAIVLVPIGRIADIHGRKKIFLWGLVLFTISCFVSAFVGSVQALIALRVLQGAGAAMVVTTGMAILTSVIPPKKRGKAIGIYVSAVYIGLSVGPFAGGFITQHIGWRCIFIVVSPFGLISTFITLRFLKGEWADAKGERLDIPGSLLYSAAVFLLIYGLTFLPERIGLYLMVAGAVSMIAFIRHEHRVTNPVFEIRLFTENKLFAFSSFAALINYAATFSVTFLMSLYLQYIKGMSPQDAGTILVAQPLCMALFSPVAGKISDKIEPRIIASAGMALTAVSLVMLKYISASTHVAVIICVLMILGFGFALFSSPNMNAIMGSVEKQFYGLASGTVSTMRLLGQMISMAIATMVFSIIIGSMEIRPESYALFLRSMKICFTIAAAMCFVGMFFSFFRGGRQE